MTSETRLRVLVVDDTILYRKIVSDILAGFPDVEVVGTANDGEIALSRIASLKPDLLTLDIEMPKVDGLTVLARLKAKSLDVGAIVLSNLTQGGGEMTMRALELGAFDFIPKPQTGTLEENKKAIHDALAPMLKAFARRREIRSILRGQVVDSSSVTSSTKSPVDFAMINRRKGDTFQRRVKSKIVCFGVSTGGPNALAQILPKLPPDLGVPILIVQHMPPTFTQSLANSLNSKCSLRVREAVDGQPLVPGVILIAPGGKQMKVAAGRDGTRIIRITDDPPENSCKPSVDYLFRSIASHYEARATGVILTGMGSDGTLGLKLMKRKGALIIAQDEGTCSVFGMPKGPIEAGIVDVISPLDRIAEEIVRTVK